MTLARLKRLHKLPNAISLNGLREMEEKDIVAVTELFTRYMTRFEMVPICTVEEFRHQLLSGMGEGKIGSGGVGRRAGQVTWSYVVEVNLYTLINDHDMLIPICASRILTPEKSPIFSRFIHSHRL
jgi:hypothetical protein